MTPNAPDLLNKDPAVPTLASSDDKKAEPAVEGVQGSPLLLAASSLRLEMGKKRQELLGKDLAVVVTHRKTGKQSPEGLVRAGQALHKKHHEAPCVESEPVKKKHKVGSLEEEAFRAQAWGVPQTLLEMHRVGCGSCRYRAGCCDSCWKRRGFGPAAAGGA